MIVCGTDLSDQGARALGAGLALARRFHERLVAAQALDGTITLAKENTRCSLREHALQMLGKEAARFGDRVKDARYAAFAEGQAATPEERARLSRALTGRLSDLVPPTADKRGVGTRLQVVEAHDVAEAILQASRRTGPDVLFLGTRQRSAVARNLLGSIAERVFRHGEMPVFFVQERRVE